MKTVLLALTASISFLIGGCQSIQLQGPDIQQQMKVVKNSARIAVVVGLKEMWKNDEKRILIARRIVELASANIKDPKLDLSQACDFVSDFFPGEYAVYVQSALDILSDYIVLEPNLSENERLLVSAFLLGVKEGAELLIPITLNNGLQANPK